jgi:hypothetical protein
MASYHAASLSPRLIDAAIIAPAYLRSHFAFGMRACVFVKGRAMIMPCDYDPRGFLSMSHVRHSREAHGTEQGY